LVVVPCRPVAGLIERHQPTPGDNQGLSLAIVEDDAPVSEAMPGILKELSDLMSSEMKILDHAKRFGGSFILKSKGKCDVVVSKSRR
jgi:hypothetical protein